MEEKTKKKSIKGRIILLILLLGIAALAGWTWGSVVRA